jgi:hypothetical protein
MGVATLATLFLEGTGKMMVTAKAVEIAARRVCPVEQNPFS